jgi:hypothetical protein
MSGASAEIRNVVIVTSIEVDPGSVDAFSRAKAGVSETKRETAGLDDKLKALRRTMKDTAEAYVRGNEQAGRSLEMLREKEKELTEQIKRRDEALAGANDQAKRGSVGGAVAGGVRSVGRGLQGVQAFLGQAMIPVAVVTMAPQIINGLAGVVKAVRGGITGGDRGQFGADMDAAVLGFGQAIGWIDEEKMGLAEFRAQMVQLRQSELTSLKAIRDSQLAVHEDRIKGLQDEQKSVVSLVKALDSQIESARSSFGLLDAREQQSVASAAKTVARTGDVSGLTKEQLEVFKTNPAFAALLKDQAGKSADAAGFADVLRNLGVTEKREKLVERSDKIEANLQNTFNITVRTDKLIDELEAKIAPMLEQVGETAVAAIRTSQSKLEQKFRTQFRNR